MRSSNRIASELLLDTHSFLWFIAGDTKLSQHAAKAIRGADTTVYVSLVSMWEVAIKHAKGRLKLDDPPKTFFEVELGRNRFKVLPLLPEHVFVAAALESTDDHRDPFDRAIVAQALIERLGLVSIDARLDQYGVQRIW